MSSFPYKNPLSSVQTVGVTTVPRSATFGTSYSVNNTGGYMEVYSLNDLIYTIPTGTTGSIEYSGNTIPIDFIKGTGDAWSPNVLTLGSDNISSGRRRLGMLVYVYEEDQVYQFHISGYTSLFTAATASTNCVVMSDFGTTVKNNTAAGQNFINAWTASTIEDVSGYTSSNATWRKFNTGSSGGTGVSGSGTVNYIPKWNSSTSLTNSQIYDNGSFVGIGTTTQVYSEGLNVSSGGIFNQYGIFDITGDLSIGIVDYDTSVWGAIDSIAIGFYGTMSNSTSGPNISIGAQSSPSLTTGQFNTIVGTYSSAQLTTGSRNTFIGDYTGGELISGTDNVVMGYNSFAHTSTGASYNTAIGVSSLDYVIGSQNVGVGSLAGNTLQGSGNTIMGYGAGGSVIGNYNVILGYTSAPSGSFSNRLHIGKSATTLIYGEFDSQKVGINVTSPTTVVHISGTTHPLRLEGLQSSANTRYLVANADGVVTYTTTSSGGISGSGTTNYIPKWTGSTGIGNSQIQDNGTTVSIGAPSSTSAILEVASTSQGVLFPRMTQAQRLAISSPTSGLIVYQTDSPDGLYIYKITGWVQII